MIPAKFWKLRTRILHLSEPKIMGVLNVTPDSFSDGGKFFEPDKAVERAFQMVEAGADLIDIGGESTRPGSKPVPPEEEWRRLEAVLKKIIPNLRVPISVDTRHGEIARRALDLGAEIINDISGGQDSELLTHAAKNGAGYVLMHMRAQPSEMMKFANYRDVVREVQEEMEESLIRVSEFSLESPRIAVDPGFGFAKTSEQNFEILASLHEFTKWGHPLLVGLSRKRMLRDLVGNDERKLAGASVSAAVLAWSTGSQIFRVHDVAETVGALKAFQKLTNGLRIIS